MFRELDGGSVFTQLLGVGSQVPAAASTSNKVFEHTCERCSLRNSFVLTQKVPFEGQAFQHSCTCFTAAHNVLHHTACTVFKQLLGGFWVWTTPLCSPAGVPQPPVLVQITVGSFGLGAKNGLLHIAVQTRWVVPSYTKVHCSHPSVPAEGGKQQHETMSSSSIKPARGISDSSGAHGC
jgi:hypothetical protein